MSNEAHFHPIGIVNRKNYSYTGLFEKNLRVEVVQIDRGMLERIETNFQGCL